MERSEDEHTHRRRCQCQVHRFVAHFADEDDVGSAHHPRNAIPNESVSADFPLHDNDFCLGEQIRSGLDGDDMFALRIVVVHHCASVVDLRSAGR